MEVRSWKTPMGRVRRRTSRKRWAAAQAARRLGGVHHGVEACLDLGVVGLVDLVEDVSDFVGPAALDGDAGTDHGQGGHPRDRLLGDQCHDAGLTQPHDPARCPDM